MNKRQFTVKFWGVRGGYPAPGFETAGVGGNTTCMEIWCAGNLIIVDAGTGIIGLGRDMRRRYEASGEPIVATLLFTHTHHDHTQGFPFFEPARIASSSLYTFGPKMLHEDLEEVLSRAMLPPVFPITLEELPCTRVIRNVKGSDLILLSPNKEEPQVIRAHLDNPYSPEGVVKIKIMRSYAHPGGVFIYRIEGLGRSLVVATDTEG